MHPSRLAPYPYDVTLTHPEVGEAGLILQAGSDGTKLIRHRYKGLEGVTPTDYSYGAQSPYRARESIFKRLVMGYGQPVQEQETSQRYDHAMGMDWSCGLGVLPTLWNGPVTVGTGPIKDIKQMLIGTTRHLFVLSGNRLYDSTAANITPSTVFTLVRDFSVVAATPSAPTHTIFGTPGSDLLRYCIAYNSVFSAGAGAPTATWSAVSPPHLVTNANFPLGAGRRVDVSWAASPDGYGTELYKSDDGGLTWTWKHFAAGVTTYQDDGTALVTATLPTVVTVFQTPYQLWPGYYSGPLLMVGMDVGPFWMWDGAAWTISGEDGRAVTQQGYNLYRSSAFDPTHSSRIGSNAAYSTTQHPVSIGTGTAGAAWTTLYQSWGPFPVTRIAPMGSTLIVCEEQRIAIGAAPSGASPVNTSISMDITPEHTSPPSADNGRCGTVWQGSFYTPYGNGFYRITPTSQSSATVENIGPERLIENTSAVKGRVTACAGWGPWHLFFTLWDGTNSYLCKYGAWRNPEEANSAVSSLLPVVHGAIETWPARVNWLEIAEVGEPATTGNARLYAGFQDGTIRWTTLPAQSPFAPTDPVCRYRSTGYTVLSRHTLGFQLDDKHYQHLTAFGPTISAKSRVRYYYVLPDGTERELPGEVTENGLPLDFPVGASGKWIQIKVVLETDDPTVTPVLEGVSLQEQLVPASLEEISFSAYTAPRLLLRHNHPTRTSARTLVRTLRGLEAKGDDVLLTLPDGSTERVSIVDLKDHYLNGSTFTGERHEIDLTLVVFKVATPDPSFGGF